jgi:hypothetical protein
VGEHEKSTDDWLSTPETDAAFTNAVTSFLAESDRGAVLIAAETVSNHLEESFRRLSPEFFVPRLRTVLNYPGPLSSLSSRADAAALFGLLSENAYNAINLLRRIRNNAAHSQGDFLLSAEAQRMNEMLGQIGDNIPHALRNMGTEILLRTAFEKLKKSGVEMAATLGRNPFETDEQIAKVVGAHPTAKDLLEQRLPRMELGLAIWLLIGLMTFQRDKFVAARQQPAP